MTCIHWLLGSCRDGLLDEESKTVHECPFLHDVIVHDKEHENGGEVNPSEAAEQQPPFSANDEEHFPALSASTSTSTTPFPAPPTASTPSKSFLQVALTTAPQKTSMPPPSLPPSSSSSSSSRSTAANVSRKRLESLWIMGGEEVRQTYVQARAEATKAAKARNQYFMRATEAFQRGDKAAAKALGQEGRRWNAAMKARHKAAALAIFASRNPSESKIYEEGVLDLHGLHVQEAMEALEELLPDIFLAGKTGRPILFLLFPSLPLFSSSFSSFPLPSPSALNNPPTHLLNKNRRSHAHNWHGQALRWGFPPPSPALPSLGRMVAGGGWVPAWVESRGALQLCGGSFWGLPEWVCGPVESPLGRASDGGLMKEDEEEKPKKEKNTNESTDLLV